MPVSPAAEALLVAFDEVQLAEMHAAASARIKQVRALHRQEYEACAWCSTNDRHVPWPCPTVRALDGKEQPGAQPGRKEGEIEGWIEIIDAATSEEPS